MGASVAHHKNLSSVEGGSSALEQNPSANQTPIKEKPTSQKQRRKTFSSLGIRGSFDFMGGSFDVGSSKVDQCSPVAEEEKPPDLTDREKELLTETWKELEDNIAKVGVITFVSLFETHPDVQQSFMSFSGIDIEDLKHSKQLRAHALRVMAFVQKAVARLHEPDKLETLLRELGKKHVTYGAKQKYVEEGHQIYSKGNFDRPENYPDKNWSRVLIYGGTKNSYKYFGPYENGKRFYKKPLQVLTKKTVGREEVSLAEVICSWAFSVPPTLVGPQFILAIKPSLEELWNDELHQAWTHLFKIIEYIMVSSMDDEQRRIKSAKE